MRARKGLFCGSLSRQSAIFFPNDLAARFPGTIVNPSTGVLSTLQTIYLEFIVGVTSSPQVVNGVNVNLPAEGDNSFVMNLPNIMNASVGVTKDTVPLPTSLLDRLSFTPIYTLNNITITLSPSPDTKFVNGDLIVVTGLQFVAL